MIYLQEFKLVSVIKFIEKENKMHRKLTVSLPIKLKLRRIELNLTQKNLAMLARTQQKSISRYESGKSLPTLPLLKRLASVLKVPIAYFLEGKVKYGVQLPSKQKKHLTDI